MSHELRSPLNAILGFAQLLESGAPPPPADQKASVDQILKAGWYLLQLINEILDLALIASGRLSLSLAPVSLPDVMLECRAMIEPQAQKLGVTLIFPAIDSPVFVHADRTRMKQVLINLLSKENPLTAQIPVLAISANAMPHDVTRGLEQGFLAYLTKPINVKEFMQTLDRSLAVADSRRAAREGAP